MLPTQPGLYLATASEIGIGETKDNKLPQAVIRYSLTHELSDDEWIEVSPGFEINGYHCMVDKKGAVIEFWIRQLRSAFGWQTADPFDLLVCQGAQVKIQLKEDMYKADGRMEVSWIGSVDDQPGGGVPQADADTQRRIRASLGPKLRALGVPVTTPKPKATPAAVPAPVAKTAPPKAAPPAKAPPPTNDDPPTATDSTKDAVWQQFCKMYPEGETAANEYLKAIGDRNPDTMTATEWGLIMADLVSTPF